MSTTSVKSKARALGIDGGFSLVRDFFDYKYGINGKTSLSLRSHIRTLSMTGLSIDIIAVGWLNEERERQNIARAVHRLRRIYARAQIGIRRVSWHSTSNKYANKDAKFTAAEAKNMIEDVSEGKKKHVDVFFVPQLKPADTLGWHFGLDGVIVRYDDDGIKMGKVLAHELGHFFGLCDRKKWSTQNLMYKSYKGGETLTAWQGGHLVSNIKRFNKDGDGCDIEAEGGSHCKGG